MTGTRSLTIVFATLALAGSLHGLLSAQQGNPHVGTGFVSGQVGVGGTNKPVPGAIVTQFIVSAEPGARTPPSRRIFAVQPDQNGRYSLPDVPGGDYLITAIADIDPGDWFNPDVLARLAPTAAPVRIRRGDALEIDLETR